MENPFKKVPILKRIIENNRIWRFDYFFWSLVYFLVVLVFMIPIALISKIFDENDMTIIYIIGTPLIIYWYLLNIRSAISRFHDINMSWWHFLWFLMTFISIIFWLILIFKSWDEWTNRFWLSPKDLLDLEKKLKNNEISKEEYDEKTKNSKIKFLDL